MSDWVDVAPAADIAPGASRSVEVDGTMIAVFDGGILTGGKVEGDQVVCPRHGAHFSIRTAEVLSPPAYENVATFPVRVSNGTVQVRDPRWD
ncbi:MAG: Rieske 2Fe-2S domain-containing protein [Betaproteobacteria bacterium]|nr:MAG: Rieske 2Fe-2S domain-containing protein [Betaproteobacteria bacterium]